MTGKFVGMFKVFIHHGSIYVGDSRSRTMHLEWDPGATHIDVKPDSVAFAVQASVDGPVSVEVWHGTISRELAHEYFNGELSTPSGHILIADPNQDIMMVVPANQGTTRTRIFANELKNAQEIQILVE